MPKITVHGGPTSYLHQVLEGPAPELEVVAEVASNKPAHDYSTRAFADLRTEARERGLPSGGTRDDLIQRLTEADRS